MRKASLAVLEYAVRYPNRWHAIGKEATDRSAIDLLAKRGVFEVDHANQCRLEES